jgi:hypothetical protein
MSHAVRATTKRSASDAELDMITVKRSASDAEIDTITVKRATGDAEIDTVSTSARSTDVVCLECLEVFPDPLFDIKAVHCGEDRIAWACPKHAENWSNLDYCRPPLATTTRLSDVGVVSLYGDPAVIKRGLDCPVCNKGIDARSIPTVSKPVLECVHDVLVGNKYALAHVDCLQDCPICHTTSALPSKDGTGGDAATCILCSK